MTTIVSGMTPAQYVAAMNSNFAAAKYNASAAYTTLTTGSSLDNINTNLQKAIDENTGVNVTLLTAGGKSSDFAVLENANFSSIETISTISFRDFSGIEKYVSNPNVLHNTNAWNAFSASNPLSRVENKIGNDYYAPIQASSAYTVFRAIGMGYSSDLITWNLVDTPILTRQLGAWDQDWMLYPSMIRIGDLWYIYYSATDPAGKHQIGFATCPVGSDLKVAANWTKYAGNPCLTEANNSAEPCVIKIGEIYYMYYITGTTAATYKFKYATSPDGITWTPQALILQANATDWCAGRGMNDSWVIRRQSDGIYELTFALAGNPQLIGYAVSRDGIHWKLYQGQIIQRGGAGTWDEYEIGNPALTELPDGTTYLGYIGVPVGYDRGDGGFAIV